jgi:hypothetical protein
MRFAWHAVVNVCKHAERGGTSNKWVLKMTSAVTNEDGSQILSFSGAEFGTHAINANTSCAIDYVWIVSDLENGRVQPDEQLKANENSLTDDVLSLLLDIQRTSDKINALSKLKCHK